MPAHRLFGGHPSCARSASSKSFGVSRSEWYIRHGQKRRGRQPRSRSGATRFPTRRRSSGEKISFHGTTVIATGGSSASFRGVSEFVQLRVSDAGGRLAPQPRHRATDTAAAPPNPRTMVPRSGELSTNWHIQVGTTGQEPDSPNCSAMRFNDAIASNEPAAGMSSMS